jgi:S-adenosylmethionine hydrolase
MPFLSVTATVKESMPTIALLTDFGTRDWYVAAIKGVILKQAPQATLVDITHHIPPQDTLAGAFVLSQAFRWFPHGTIFLCIVDPGVGTERRLLLVHLPAQDHFFIAPDNGLVSLALQAVPSYTAYQLKPNAYWQQPVSNTFHGRDILAPTAAALAQGTPLTALATPTTGIKPLHLPEVTQQPSTCSGQVIYIDAFGNAITNIPATHLQVSAPLHAQVAGRTIPFYKTYAAATHPGMAALIPGSTGLFEIAVTNGSAAHQLDLKPGSPVRVCW